MKESVVAFWKKVFQTTFCAFFFVTMIYLGFLAVTSGGKGGDPTTLFQVVGYLAGKLYMCIFPFSLCLGLAARVFDSNKARALQRLIHICLCFAAYFVFMDLIFLNTNSFFFSDIDAGDTPVSEYIKFTLPFFLGYPLTAGITALGRAIFGSKVEKKEYKSILD